MSEPTFSFICAECGELHQGSPSFSFAAPFFWSETPDWDEGSRLDSDLCVSASRDHFIRCILEIPIIGSNEPFLWGVWLSQSEENWLAYEQSFPDTPEWVTFGYLANRVPGYQDTLNLETQVHWRTGGQRPWVELDEVDHPLCLDWRNGITWDRAIELATIAMHGARKH